MEIEDYLELYSSNIRTQIKTNPTSFTEASLKQALIDIVNPIKTLSTGRLHDSKDSYQYIEKVSTCS